MEELLWLYCVANSSLNKLCILLIVIFFSVCSSFVIIKILIIVLKTCGLNYYNIYTMYGNFFRMLFMLNVSRNNLLTCLLLRAFLFYTWYVR